MSKLSKVLIVVLALPLLSVLTHVIVVNAMHVFPSSPISQFNYGFKFSRFWEELFSQYLFWVAVAFSVCILIGILVVLLFPRTKTEILLEDNQGQLLMSKTAIEGYVRSLVDSKGLMRDIYVSTTLMKRKFKVGVKGQMIPNDSIGQKVALLKTDIETGLKEFFGLDTNVDFKVTVKDVPRGSRGSIKNRVR